MTPIPSRTNVRVLSAQYFIYFAVLGLYLPFFNLWLHRAGFSGERIGAVSGVRSAAVVVMPLLWALAADRFKSRRALFFAANLLAACVFSAYLFTKSFWPVLAITAAWAVFYAPIVSFMEAFSMEILGAERNRYGRVRVWGSLSFIAVVLLAGQGVSALGVSFILPVILFGSGLQAVVSWRFPDLAADARMAPRLSRRELFHFRRPATLVFLAASFLMLASHGAYYGFYSIRLDGLGYSGSFIGAMWALATGAEVVVMLKSEAILNRYSPRVILCVSLGAAALRWGLLAVARGPGLFIPIQLLHALTYATFHVTSIVYMERLIPPGARTVGQAVNNAVTYGAGLAAGFAVTGFAWERWGAEKSFILAAGMALAGGLMFVGEILYERSRERR